MAFGFRGKEEMEMAVLPIKREGSLMSLRSGLDRLFDDFFRGWEVTPWVEKEWYPSLDVSETEGEVIVKAEIPGMDPRDLDITLSDDALSIRGEKKEETEEKKKNYHRKETRYGSFSRTVQLPALVDTEKTKADYDKGVLTITAPKKEGKKTKKIEVEVK
jgi:HSP20 family protein